jgi:hypothetical protein
MFTYAVCHLISHATGLFLLAGIQGIGHDILLAPWRTPAGLWILLAAFLTHLSLGLTALYRRRHLRMPAIEAWQLGLGLSIPLLLAPHVSDARLAVLLYGVEDSYARVLYLFWLNDPVGNLPRQFALVAARLYRHPYVAALSRLVPAPCGRLRDGRDRAADPGRAGGDKCRLGHHPAWRDRAGICRGAWAAPAGLTT